MNENDEAAAAPVPGAAPETEGAKLKSVLGGGGSAAKKYFDVTYGPMPLWKAVLMEILQLFLCNVPGALGLFLRSKLYRPFFGACGRRVAIGRGVTLRHPTKIFLGEGVVVEQEGVAAGEEDVGDFGMGGNPAEGGGRRSTARTATSRSPRTPRSRPT